MTRINRIDYLGGLYTTISWTEDGINKKKSRLFWYFKWGDLEEGD